MFLVCEGWAGDGDRLLFWPSSTSFSSWLGCSTVGHWGPKALCLPLALNSASCPQLTSTDSSRLGHLVILLLNVHLLPLFFRLFTQVHLLIDGSVEGKYVTVATIGRIDPIENYSYHRGLWIKLFVLDRNTWFNITVCIQWMQIPNLLV